MTAVAVPEELSFGVEEEYLVTCVRTGATVPEADRVLRVADRRPRAAPDAGWSAELRATQVEASTGWCRSLAEVGGQLRHARRTLTRTVPGVRLLASGTAPLGIDPVVRGDRPGATTERYSELFADQQACGCRVYVGVRDQATAVAVTDHVRPWLATLLAVSVNSPWHNGVDTGHASWRMVQRSRLGAGVPPPLRTAEAHEALVDRLLDAGVLADPAMTFWLARPSPGQPAVEFRVADVALDVDGALLQAALSRALVRTSLDALDRGRVASEHNPYVLAAGVRAAARYGLTGPGVDAWTGRLRPAVDLLTDLVDAVRPALAESGDEATVDDLVKRVRVDGTGATRQREQGGPDGAVRLLVRTFPGDAV